MSGKYPQKLYKQHFGGLPVAEMLQRRWLVVDDVQSITEITAALVRFFGVKDEVELRDVLDHPDAYLRRFPGFCC